MKQKKHFVLLVVLMLSLSGYTLSHLRIDSIRANYSYRLHASAIPFSIEALKALSGEFKGIIADYLLLEAASFIGSEQSSDATPEDWSAVSRLLDQSSNLDPYFRQTYRLTQSTLPWHAHEYEKTLEILERSKSHLPWDWQPGFFIGFDYHFFFNDNATAAKNLMEASKVQGAPLTLSTFASRLASNAGQTSGAIDFLTSVYEKTDDEAARRLLSERITALKGVIEIQEGINRFKLQYGRLPNILDELVEKDILHEIPENPYDRPYTLKEGHVEF